MSCMVVEGGEVLLGADFGTVDAKRFLCVEKQNMHTIENKNITQASWSIRC